MSDRVDLREFVVGFIVESDELVAAANAALLDIEAAQLAGGLRPRAVRELFRALHTLKGLAGMIGVEPIVELAHGLEGLIRTADRAGGALTREVVDVSLRGVAAIAECVRAVDQQRGPPATSAELLDAIAAAGGGGGSRAVATPAAITEAASPAPRAPVWGGALSAAEQQQLAAGWRAGQRAWRASFVPSESNARRGVTIAVVRARLGEVGDVVKVAPRTVSDQAAGIVFDLLVISAASPEAIAAAAPVDQLIEIAAPAAAAASAAGPRGPAGDTVAWASAGAAAGAGSGLLGRAFVRVELGRLDELQDQLSSLFVSRFRLEREIAALVERGVDVRALCEVVHQQRRQLRDLRRAILRARTVRVAEVLEPLALLVRSLGRGVNKQVRLELDARDAELDKAVADRLLPALVHLVRNAVDHAIEPADERLARGKPRDGMVRVSCFEVGGSRLEIVVEDDGRGIDRAAVAARAGRPVDSDADLLDVLTAPGFSTRDVATPTSGRGVGMDIVRRIATGDLGGELTVVTAPGAGTAFTLRVPLTIAVVDVFSFTCGRQTFVVPVAAVDEIFELRHGQDVIPPAAPGAASPVRIAERRGQAIAVHSLGTLLRIDDGAAARKAIVIRRQGVPVGFTVDRMLGRHEVVVRPIDDALLRVPGVSGATDLGDGLPTLVLDLHALGVRSAERPAS